MPPYRQLRPSRLTFTILALAGLFGSGYVALFRSSPPPPAIATNTTIPRPVGNFAATSAKSATTHDSRSKLLPHTIPPGEFLDSLLSLSPPARERAEDWLRRRQPPRETFQSLRLTPDGHVYHVCDAPLSESPDPAPEHPRRIEKEIPADTSEVSARYLPAAAPSSVPIAEPPALHSKPGAANTLYLDFNGHIISGTLWNTLQNIASYSARPFDNDGDPTTFNAAEQAIISETWARVAEDFAPFDIDVTTEPPPDSAARVGRVLITPRTDANGLALPGGNVAGVALADSFGSSDPAQASAPALVYLSTGAADIAEAASHEFGHCLGLSHDGTTNGLVTIPDMASARPLGRRSWAQATVAT